MLNTLMHHLQQMLLQKLYRIPGQRIVHEEFLVFGDAMNLNHGGLILLEQAGKDAAGQICVIRHRDLIETVARDGSSTI